MSNVVPLPSKLYNAKSCVAQTEFGDFEASGTICGHVDFRGPFPLIYPLSTDEVTLLIAALTEARDDVLKNSRPLSDPRLYSDR